MSSDKIITQTHLPSAFYEYCDQPCSNRHKNSRAAGSYRDSWTGTQNYAEAQALARKGWPEGTQKARKLADKLSAELVASVKRPEIQFDVTGDMFDMGRVVDGTPESWMIWEEGQEDGGKPLHVVFNPSVSCGIDTKLIEVRGAAVCALVIVLEASGRPTKVEIASGISDEGQFLEPRVILKDYYDPIQIDAIAYALIHPSFFRRHLFSAMERMGIVSDYYGFPADVEGPKGDIYLGKAYYGDKQWASEAAAEKWIKEQLQLQGVTFR